VEHIPATVVGGGQAGLAMSHELAARGVEHVVLERGRIAQTWRDRWDSFCLVTPNWTARLPGFAYDDPAQDGFMPATTSSALSSGTRARDRRAGAGGRRRRVARGRGRRRIRRPHVRGRRAKRRGRARTGAYHDRIGRPPRRDSWPTSSSSTSRRTGHPARFRRAASSSSAAGSPAVRSPRSCTRPAGTCCSRRPRAVGAAPVRRPRPVPPRVDEVGDVERLRDVGAVVGCDDRELDDLMRVRHCHVRRLGHDRQIHAWYRDGMGARGGRERRTGRRRDGEQAGGSTHRDSSLQSASRHSSTPPSTRQSARSHRVGARARLRPPCR
jgi:hypothetical protein